MTEPTLRETLDRLLAEVERGELHADSLREAIEDAYDMNQITAAELAEWHRKIDQAADRNSNGRK